MDKYGYGSKAEATIELLDPLFENPEEYNLVVSKFKIDTESIPLMIPELEQPQDPKGGTVKTTYKVKVNIKYYDLNTDPTRRSPLEASSESSVYIPMNFPSKGMIDMGQVTPEIWYTNNLDPQYYIHDYRTFITGINNAMQKAFVGLQNFENDFGNKPFAEENYDLVTRAYFEIGDDNKLIFKHHYNMGTSRVIKARPSLEITETIVEFSYNLYKYIGNGFQCFFNPDKSSFYYNLAYYPKAEQDNYGDAKQSFCTFCNWQCLKALVIGSNNLPVVEEYLPISHFDGFLTHYETEEYKKGLRHHGISYKKDNRSQFKKNTQRVLTVYYPSSSQPGDSLLCYPHDE